jgi:hypothetical protein
VRASLDHNGSHDTVADKGHHLVGTESNNSEVYRCSLSPKTFTISEELQKATSSPWSGSSGLSL